MENTLLNNNIERSPAAPADAPVLEATLRIAGVVRESIVDGAGIRFAVFCQGCPHHCPGCHNPETHDFSGGYDISVERILEEVDKDPLLSGITFSGGDPACQPYGFLQLAKGARERGLNVWMYSGYTLEELDRLAGSKGNLKELMEYVDVLIDGRFEEDKKDLTLKYRGSQNQRVIKLPETRRSGHVVLYDEE